jgi:hypothetical protein
MAGKKRNRKKKSNSIIGKILRLVPALCVIAVVLLFYMLFDMRKQIDESYYKVDNDLENNETNTENIANAYANTYTNNEISNTNEIINNSAANKVSNVTPTNKTNTNIVTSAEKTSDTTDKKLKAEKIVEKNWGTDDSVSFDCYVNNSGEYIVSVTDIQSGKVLTYYLVDLDTEEISIY